MQLRNAGVIIACKLPDLRNFQLSKHHNNSLVQVKEKLVVNS